MHIAQTSSCSRFHWTTNALPVFEKGKSKLTINKTNVNHKTNQMHKSVNSKVLIFVVLCEQIAINGISPLSNSCIHIRGKW